MEGFSPLRMSNRKFDLDLAGEEIKNDKGKRIGKVIASTYNAGTAMIDITKITDNSPSAVYKLSDYRVLIWQPAWLDLEISK